MSVSMLVVNGDDLRPLPIATRKPAWANDVGRMIRRKGEFFGDPGRQFEDSKVIQTWHSEDWMTGLHQLRVLGE